jgi:hypothetical protein
VVLGGIATDTVNRIIGAQMAAIQQCHSPALGDGPSSRGKVLVRFTLSKEGLVSKAATLSTSLRNDTTEDCLIARLLGTRFPPLETGEIAVITYPFVFPLGG